MFQSEIHTDHHNMYTISLNALRLETLGQVKKKLNNLPDDIIDFNITNIQDYITKETWETL